MIFTVYSQDNPLTLHSTFSVNADSSKEFSVDGVVSSYPFHSMDGTPTIICSEPLFLELTGKNGYSVIDVQLKKKPQTKMSKSFALCSQKAFPFPTSD